MLKPLSSAISIGSGGPFGAEGPIIMTGGAFGSMIAQFFHLTAAERKTLLVAGAAAGMSATFAAPVAAVLLAVELLLFEWKPRSLIPVALASAIARRWRADTSWDSARYFPCQRTRCSSDRKELLGCVLVGLLAGGAVGSAHAVGVRGRRRFPASANSLDVVAGDWGTGHRFGRPDLSTGARRRLRHHRRHCCREA